MNLWEYRTRIFGFMQVTLSVFASATDMFAPATLKWIMLGNGLLTAWLGFYNASQLRDK